MARTSINEWNQGDNLIMLEAWARNGLTDQEIAHNMGIARTTLWNWKTKDDDIMNALKRGKEVIDTIIENAMVKRALGYEYEEEKIVQETVDGVMRKRIEKTKKHIAPDVTAQIFWLKNRKPEDWRDRREVGITKNKKETVDEIDKYFSELQEDDDK